MNTHLVKYIDKKLDEAASFVIRYMPVNMTTDRIYEDLVGEPHVVAAFREAVRYLPPSSLNRRTVLKLGEQTLFAQLRFAPTDAYPVFLMPKYDLAVTQESELGQALGMAIQVTREWEMLIKTWEKFREAAPDPHTLGFLFPWLREIMLDFNIGLLDVNVKLKADREKIEREVRAIHRRFPPKSFPRLSIELNRVCQSGKRLFGQYRMLEALTRENDLTRAALSIDRATNLSPAWLHEHMEECISDWFEEVMAITRQDGSDRPKRRKAFKVTVPFVTPQEKW
jgi:hypothetical protein